jgi:hypothetical protein
VGVVVFLLAADLTVEVALLEVWQAEGLFLLLLLSGGLFLVWLAGRTHLMRGRSREGFVGVGVDAAFLTALEKLVDALLRNSLRAPHETIQEG